MAKYMTPTDLDTLTTSITTAIRNITPRHQRQGEQKWIPYERKAPPAYTRRFRLDWETDEHTEGGIFTQSAVDTTVTLHVYTDYNMRHQEMDKVIEDDHWQLRDVLNTLKGTSSGIIFIESAGVGNVSENEDAPTDGADLLQVDHNFVVRYLKARA